MTLGQRNGATITDLKKVNAMYNCNGAVATPYSVNTNAANEVTENQGSSFHIF